MFLGEWTFFKIWEYDNSLFFRDIWSQKRQFCQKHTILRGKKKCQYDALFFRFFTKNQCSHAHIFLKSFLSLKTRCLYAHILSKKRTLSQKHFDFMSFFQIFYEKPPVAMPMCSKKT